VATWESKRQGDGKTWTPPDFPRYEIRHVDRPVCCSLTYGGSHPVGPIGNWEYFRGAEQLVVDEGKPVVSAAPGTL
jgi:hypothetical protein